MSRLAHMGHRGARRAHTYGQELRGLCAAAATVNPETTIAHCHHGHVVQDLYPQRSWLRPDPEKLEVGLQTYEYVPMVTFGGVVIRPRGGASGWLNAAWYPVVKH